MRCPSCGTENPRHASFCVHCGVAIFNGDDMPRLGHYRIESKLGEGGMGVVYRAIDEKLHREVAIKVLHPQLLQQENLKERFRREARMHARIMHPHIVTLLSLYEDEQHMALVMEMIHGKNLKEYLSEHPRLDLPEVVRISEAILSGLEAAHRQGMVHRDLKPANVMLANSGGIKLMDFGLAKPEHSDDDLTQSGATVGSFRYMAPEQILNQDVDARTDLYAFGILLYQMLTGRLPFDATSSGGEFEIMEKQVRHDPVPPNQVHVAIPTALSDLVMRLLAKDRANRPEDCASVQRRLLEILQQAERARSHATTQIMHPPVIQPKQTSAEIARGLIRAWSRQALRAMLRTAWALRLWLWEKPVARGRGLMDSPSVQELPQRLAALPRRLREGKGAWAWSGAGIGVLAVVWLLLGAIDMAGRPADRPAPPGPSAVGPQPETTAPDRATGGGGATDKAPAAPPIPAVRAVPASPKPAAKPPASPAPRHRQPRPRAAPEPTPVTDRVPYKVINSQSDVIDSHRANEFRGGSRLYLASLKDNRKDKYRAYEKGWVRLYFMHPVRLSAIRIRRISVTQGDFRGGSIELAVQSRHGHWTVVFRRHNMDIETPVLIHAQPGILSGVKGVRLRFRSSEPLMVGPIDLLP